MFTFNGQIISLLESFIIYYFWRNYEDFLSDYISFWFGMFIASSCVFHYQNTKEPYMKSTLLVLVSKQFSFLIAIFVDGIWIDFFCLLMRLAYNMVTKCVNFNRKTSSEAILKNVITGSSNNYCIRMLLYNTNLLYILFLSSLAVWRG